MIVLPSAARVNANRLNAARSTGPKTAEGKSRSRINALKHGLTAQVVDLPESGEQPGAAVSESGPEFGPVWLKDQLSRTMRQIDRAGRIEEDLRDEAAFHAATIWDDERMAEVEDLGTRIGREPSRTVARLRLTPHGCDWLSKRWDCLAHAARLPEGWNEAQAKLAFDLLGIPLEGRAGSVAAVIAVGSGPDRAALSPLELAETMIADLKTQRELMVEPDEIAKTLTETDGVDLPTPALVRIRRYETALHKRLDWLVGELRGLAPRINPSAHMTQPGRSQEVGEIPPAPTPTPASVRETNPASPAPRPENPSSRPTDLLPTSSGPTSFVDFAITVPRFRQRA